jgi:hypothetical protein
VCDGNNCAVFEAFVHQVLNGLLSGNIDVGCGLVQNDYLVLSQDGATDADETLLSRAEVITILLKVELEESVVEGLLFLC